MNVVWKIILILVALVAVWFVGGLVKDLYKYYSLCALAPAEVERWEVEQVGTSKFVLKPTYAFIVAGVRYENREQLLDLVYPNMWAAKGSLKRLKEERWFAHYAPSNPKKSSLSNPFPLKKSIYALICLGIVLYFFWIYMRYRGPTLG